MMNVLSFEHEGRAYTIRARKDADGFSVTSEDDTGQVIATAYVDNTTVFDAAMSGKGNVVRDLALTLKDDIERDRPAQVRRARLMVALYEVPRNSVLRFPKSILGNFFGGQTQDEVIAKAMEAITDAGFQIRIEPAADGNVAIWRL